MKSNLKFIAGRAAMALSLIGMVSMSVSAAGETELDQINRNISISEFVANLNANGKIKYDREEDGKPEVYYDFKDYQVLGDSLNTINKNEQALSEEYTRLYNLAESNRKTLIASWNKLGLLPIGENAKYVTGDGTASLRGAMEALGTAPAGTQPASEGDLLAGKSALVPGKGWIKGNMSSHSFNEISISASWDTGSNSGTVSPVYPNPKDSFYSGGDINTAAVGTAMNDAYQDGLKDGEKLASGSNIFYMHYAGYGADNLCARNFTLPAGNYEMVCAIQGYDFIGETHEIKRGGYQLMSGNKTVAATYYIKDGDALTDKANIKTYGLKTHSGNNVLGPITLSFTLNAETSVSMNVISGGGGGHTSESYCLIRKK